MPFHPASAWGVISLVAPPTHDRGGSGTRAAPHRHMGPGWTGGAASQRAYDSGLVHGD